MKRGLPKEKEKGLQKVTSRRITNLEETFALTKVTPENLPTNKKQRKRLYGKIQAHINTLKGSDLDNYLDKIKAIITPESHTRNETWERTHSQITIWIGRLMKEYNRLPSVCELSNETNYSRKTIHAHLKGFESSPFFEDQRQKFKLLNQTILSNLFRFAIAGDVRACRLFLEFTGAVNTKNIVQNYIQINSLVLTPEIVKQLPKPRLLEIENLIRTALPTRKLTNHKPITE